MTKDTIILESVMEKEFVLIGGSHHLMVLNKSGVPEHRLVFPNLKKVIYTTMIIHIFITHQFFV